MLQFACGDTPVLKQFSKPEANQLVHHAYSVVVFGAPKLPDHTLVNTVLPLFLSILCVLVTLAWRSRRPAPASIDDSSKSIKSGLKVETLQPHESSMSTSPSNLESVDGAQFAGENSGVFVATAHGLKEVAWAELTLHEKIASGHFGLFIPRSCLGY